MQNTENRKNERGAIALVAGFALIGLIGFAALVVDVGYALLTKAELQNVADVAARSGDLELGRVYDELGVDPAEYTLNAGDRARVLMAVNSYSRRNTAAAVPIAIRAEDVQFGQWDMGTATFTPADHNVTAIQVVARRDTVANGAVTSLLSSVLGKDEFEIKAEAGATLAPVAKLPRGKVDFPVGIAKAWFQGKHSPCGSPTSISFYPTGTLQGCAGWHTFDTGPARASRLKAILRAMRWGGETGVSPEVVVGETYFEFSGGTVDSVLHEAEELYEAKRDGSGRWQVHIPVYDRNDCSNPNQSIKIIGIATAVITGIDAHGGDKRIDAEVSCDVIGYGEGGGPNYGTQVGVPMIIR